MRDEKIWDTLSWYVVHTHPKQEERANGNLRVMAIETLAPKIKVNKQNPFTGELSSASKPLFPRYIFARFKANDLYHKVRFTRGIHSLVRFDDRPSPVDDEIIAIIRARIGTNGFVKLGEAFEPGDEVMITGGPFKDFAGVFELEMKEVDRVKILLCTVGYQAHIVVDKEMVKRVSHR
jgi:transcriptional antiterminator RfaH